MFELGTISQFEAAHRLVGDFGPATRMHGHTYRLEVTVEGEHLDDSNVMFDLGKLDGAVADLVSRLNYQDLNEVPALQGVNTTAEAMARFCWQELAEAFQDQGLCSLAIRLWESPRVFAGYRAALRP